MKLDRRVGHAEAHAAGSPAARAPPTSAGRARAGARVAEVAPLLLGRRALGLELFDRAVAAVGLAARRRAPRRARDSGPAGRSGRTDPRPTRRRATAATPRSAARHAGSSARRRCPRCAAVRAAEHGRSSRLKIAVRAPPTCRKPVGDGAKRARTGPVSAVRAGCGSGGVAAAGSAAAAMARGTLARDRMPARPSDPSPTGRARHPTLHRRETR